MALQTTTNINIDFYDKKHILINAKQYDKKSRFISVTCYNHGENYPINSGEHSAYIRYKKADNYGVFNPCEIDRKGKIKVELTEQMLSADGICCADLVIVNKGGAKVDSQTGEIVYIENTSILSTMPIYIDVTETAVENSDIESSYEFNGFNTALEKAEAEYTEVMKTSKSWAVGGTGIRDGEDTDNSKYYCEQSLASANNANESEANALESALTAASAGSAALGSANRAANSEANAESSALSAESSAMSASTSAASAATSENVAKGYANIAQNSMNSAMDSASSASASATSAYNYYLQAEAITNGLNGAFLPKGTITFAELIELKESGAVAAGDLYHISDNFVTDENFRVYGKECGAGTSVYYTVGDKFDYFVGATVAGVKGESEYGYRTGMVNLTAENVGAIPSTDIATVDEIKNYLGI